jgi:predicted dehydrogenase
MRAIRDNPNARLAAVCDLDLAKAQSAAEQFGADQVYQDYRQLLDDDAIDAVVVCTPDQLHREMSVAALTRGKHVLCEKPMALTVADCQAMIAAERAGQARLMIGQICRYTPGFVAAKCLIEQGVIGELFFVESEYAHDYSRSSDRRPPTIGGATPCGTRFSAAAATRSTCCAGSPAIRPR